MKIIGLVRQTVTDHQAWLHDIEETKVLGRNTDHRRPRLQRLPSCTACCPPTPPAIRRAGPPADNATVPNVFVIGPDKRVKLILAYPMTTGRNFDEVVRVIDSLQLTATHRVATPVNWKQGDDVIIAGSVPNEEATRIFGTWKEPKPDLRIRPSRSSPNIRPRGARTAVGR